MELIGKIRDKVTTQDYSPKSKIDGLELIELRRFVDDSGSFAELLRIGRNGEAQTIRGFFLLAGQINHSEVEPGAIKAWHIHFDQIDVWFVPPKQRLLVGLWDLREDSPTADVKIRLVLGAGRAQLLVIPPGVAHGCANLSQETVDIIYFINRQFDRAKPDEHRLPWDILGEEFWELRKE